MYADVLITLVRTSMTGSGECVLLGYGIRWLPKKLVAKIHAQEFRNLVELLPEAIARGVNLHMKYLHTASRFLW